LTAESNSLAGGDKTDQIESIRRLRCRASSQIPANSASAL
jgi:hypothetical protein